MSDANRVKRKMSCEESLNLSLRINRRLFGLFVVVHVFILILTIVAALDPERTWIAVGSFVGPLGFSLLGWVYAFKGIQNTKYAMKSFKGSMNLFTVNLPDSKVRVEGGEA